jgi:hypothetical protein
MSVVLSVVVVVWLAVLMWGVSWIACDCVRLLIEEEESIRRREEALARRRNRR